ncbi:MAG TPA: 2-oxoacid:acceptor oxidoreductase family protein, partial [Clostridia bacterium]|nr:2-oxoacid:acceptor oxidoreductase family protein [Clostridia bacterium]
MKRVIANKKLKFYNIDALKIASEVGLGNRINMVMQAAFFKLSNVIPYDKAEEYMKQAVKKTYGKKGDAIVNMNIAAIDRAIEGLKEIKYPSDWANATTGAAIVKVPASEYFDNFVRPILSLKGDDLPVSAFSPNGFVPLGTSQFEKRGIAVNVPFWDVEACIQCNQCSMVCPHACLRPVLAKKEDLANAPESFITKPAIGKEFAGYEYRIQLTPLDCTGCGNCADVCPAKGKALFMKPLDELAATESRNYDFSRTLPKTDIKYNTATVKGSQFMKPLFEFSGACAGCGETPYVKLVTQLFGDRMIIANATGCSSIYGGHAPTCPYTVNDEGHGPAWANSLFEDNAEFGFGINLAINQRRMRLATLLEQLKEKDTPESWGLKAACEAWLAGADDAEASKEASKLLKAAIDKAIAECGSCGCDCDELYKEVKSMEDIFVKKSIWIIGGDGW